MIRELESVRCGFRDLQEQPVSSFLVICGMAFGIAVTLLILSISKCAEQVIIMYMTANGDGNYLSVNVTYTDDRISAEPPSIPAELYYAFADTDYQYLYGIDYQSGIQPEVYCVGDDAKELYALKGCAPAAAHLDRLTLVCGRFLTDADCKHEIMTVVLPQTLAVKMFGNEQDALGGDLHFYDANGILFPAVVSGVYKWIDTGEPDSVKTIYAPYSAVDTCWNVTQPERITGFHAAYQSGVLNESAATQEILSFFNPQLAQEHLQVRITAPEPLGEDMQKRIYALTAALLCVAGLTYFVSCMGMVNVLLVSVRRKTMEIGVRKAIGADSRLIRLQFFTESMCIRSVGCVLGVGFGMLIQHILAGKLPALLTEIMGEEYQYLIMHTEFSLTPSLFAILFFIVVTLLCGWFSGLHPAEQAMHMTVADALRFE